MNQKPMEPRVRVVLSENQKGAIVGGFDESLVIEESRLLVLNGYIPVSQEHTFMEHIPTGNRGHYCKVTLIKNASSL